MGCGIHIKGHEYLDKSGEECGGYTLTEKVYLIDNLKGYALGNMVQRFLLSKNENGGEFDSEALREFAQNCLEQDSVPDEVSTAEIQIFNDAADWIDACSNRYVSISISC